MDYVALTLRLAWQNFKAKQAYTVDFWFLFLSYIAQMGAGLVVLWTIFGHVRIVNGWNLAGMVFLYGVQILAMGLYRGVFQGVNDLSRLISTGELDVHLTKPRNTLFLVSTHRTNLMGIANLFFGIALVWSGASRLAYNWGPVDVLLLVAFVLSGNLISASLVTVAHLVSIWLVRSYAVHDIVLQFYEFTKYPLSIYNVVIRIILTTVIPFGFATFYPANYFLGHGHYAWFGLFSPVVALLVGYLTYLFWKFSLKHYQSTGF